MKRIPRSYPPLLAYGAALLSVAVATGIRLPLNSVWQHRYSYPFYYVAVMFTAWFAGLGPALFATLLSSVIIEWLFILPNDVAVYGPGPDQTSLVMYVVVCVYIAFVTSMQRTAHVNLEASLSRSEEQQRRLEEEIRKREEAETERQRVHEDLKIAHNSLLQRSEELQLAVNELEAFSYTVSHDLRAPLRSIDGYTHILHEQCVSVFPPEALRTLQQIHKNIKNMSNLIDDLLRFSRLSRQPITRQVVRVEEMVGEIVDDLKRSERERQVQLTIAGLAGWRVEADPNLLRQVFVNLLANAYKYSRKRDVAVISAGVIEKEGTPVFFVRDNGVGFPMKYVDQLFRVFQRLHLQEEYEGTGVGLAIVHRIVTRHGGKVWAESELNKGSTFYFHLGSPAYQTATGAVTPLETPALRTSVAV